MLNGEVFIKQAEADPSKTYPDFGCSLETFTNNEFIEIETLGPLTKVDPGKTVENIEHWSLHRNVNLPAKFPTTPLMPPSCRWWAPGAAIDGERSGALLLLSNWFQPDVPPAG